MVKKMEYHTLHTIMFLQLVLCLWVFPVLYSLENWCSVPKRPGTWELQQGLHLHIFMSNLVLFKRCTTQEAKMSPSCFHSHSRKGSPMTHSHAVLIHWQLPSWQQNATFTKLYKSLLLSGASWTKTEYIFTARTRFWANFLHFVAKRYDTYVKETFIFCSLTTVRSWGMWKKSSFIYSNRRQSCRDSW